MESDVEAVQGELVALEPTAGELTPARPGLSPAAVQAAAVAATGFAAGVATIAVVHRRRVRRAGRRRRTLANVVASRSFLVDVHVLGDRS
jgi:hypothetical protein